jgi:hypothetical protein
MTQMLALFAPSQLSEIQEGRLKQKDQRHQWSDKFDLSCSAG